jgi:hypothetical protein
MKTIKLRASRVNKQFNDTVGDRDQIESKRVSLLATFFLPEIQHLNGFCQDY